jgi:hypothetical protein
MTGTLIDVPHQCIGARQGSFLNACLFPAVCRRPELRLARLHSTAGSSTRAGAGNCAWVCSTLKTYGCFLLAAHHSTRQTAQVQAQEYFTSGPGEPTSSELLSSIAGSVAFACRLRTSLPRVPVPGCARQTAASDLREGSRTWGKLLDVILMFSSRSIQPTHLTISQPAAHCRSWVVACQTGVGVGWPSLATPSATVQGHRSKACAFFSTDQYLRSAEQAC